MTEEEVLSMPSEIRLRVSNLTKFLATAGQHTHTEQAEFLGMPGPTWSRIRHGRMRVGEKTIAAILRAFPHCSFDDFFVVSADADDAEVVAV